MDEKPVIIKRNIKYPRIEMKTGNLILILPKERKILIDDFLKKHQKWIENKHNLIKNIENEYKTKKLINRKEENFYKLVENFVNEAKTKLDVEVKKVQFRLMKTKWGSFTKKRVINLNILAKFLPSKLIKYIVFHEMTHSLFPKHNKSFWLKIESRFPNYQKYERALLGYWFLIHIGDNDFMKDTIKILTKRKRSINFRQSI